jgi:biopolymer transport protein ExbB
MDSHLIRNRLLGVLLACSLIVLWSGEARAWWNEEWSGREKITIDTTTSGADIHAGADEIPVLVRLHTGNIDFTRIKEDGSDIRFVSSDDKVMLKHHIELLDITDEMALIWVRAPKIAAASKADFIWLYYDNKKAPRADDTKGTYDKNYVAVFHFAEAEGMPKDATGYGNNVSAFSGSLGLPAIVGKGVTLGGGADKIVIQSNPSLDISGGFTFSSWIRINTAQSDAYLLYRADGDKAITIGIDKTRLYCRLKSG